MKILLSLSTLMKLINWDPFKLYYHLFVKLSQLLLPFACDEQIDFSRKN